MNSNVKDLNLVFSTPIWSFLVDDYEKINNTIFKYIKNIQKEDPIGVKKSNNLGWHSKSFDMENEVVKSFFNSIQKYINKTIKDSGWDHPLNKFKVTSAWSIINSKNSSNARHIHSNNYLSAAYYVKAPKNCGDIIFYDPRDAKVIRKPKSNGGNFLNADIININPQEGLLVMFPSYLHHSVDDNISENERIVISFNIDIR